MKSVLCFFPGGGESAESVFFFNGVDQTASYMSMTSTFIDTTILMGGLT